MNVYISVKSYESITRILCIAKILCFTYMYLHIIPEVI